MMVSLTCSWCHTANTSDGRPVICRNCGHRADVARMDCDCTRCDQIERVRQVRARDHW